jgi:enterobactin synthetase component D / holo-[acyl-carrier protein] synthase
MDLSPVTQTLPDNVSLVVVNDSDSAHLEVFAEETRLLPPTTSLQRMAEFRLGRRAAHLAMSKIGLDPEPILRGKHREPIWPPGVTGSITHDGTRALAAVALLSDVGGIGIDIEARGRYFVGLESEITRPEELAVLERMDDEKRVESTIELFSGKESIFKAHYPRIGRFFGFEAARIEIGPDHMVGYLAEPLDPRYPADRPMEIGRFWAGDSVLTWLVLPPD